MEFSSRYKSLPLTPGTQRKEVPRKDLSNPYDGWTQSGAAMQEPEVRFHQTPASPVNINPPQSGVLDPEAASIREYATSEYYAGYGAARQAPPPRMYTPESMHQQGAGSVSSLPIRTSPSHGNLRRSDERSHHSRESSASNGQRRLEDSREELNQNSGLQYSAFDDLPRRPVQNHKSNMSLGSQGSGSDGKYGQLQVPGNIPPRPTSSQTLGSDLRGRTLSPLSAHGSDNASPHRDMSGNRRDFSAARRSPAARPASYIDLLSNVPYNQQQAPSAGLNNSGLASVVGSAASLMNTKKTLEMYRMNIKKTTDASVQYEFAIFMINSARDVQPGDDLEPAELINEAKVILQRLADRAYPFAQYYLGDGYFSGVFTAKGKPDFDKAFTLFVGASKHGHAEASYRAALCYEFAWGTTKSYPKAVQFYRNAASKNHPGAATRLGLACLRGDMGLGKNTAREGLRWLKRAQESADFQYNTAPYELGLLHLTGHGDDVFKDEAYAAQLFTQAAELGHVEANYLMGQAYENGKYGCPRDAALSVHFYNGAATRGHADAMMALCAWYMVGAEPVLDKDEAEAYAWATQAAQLGMPKAEYAVGYFTEMGIGCRRDPLEANVWYVNAAEKGNETAKQRLAIIRAAASGSASVPMTKEEARAQELNSKKKKKVMGIF